MSSICSSHDDSCCSFPCPFPIALAFSSLVYPCLQIGFLFSFYPWRYSITSCLWINGVSTSILLYTKWSTIVRRPSLIHLSPFRAIGAVHCIIFVSKHSWDVSNCPGCSVSSCYISLILLGQNPGHGFIIPDGLARTSLLTLPISDEHFFMFSWLKSRTNRWSYAIARVFWVNHIVSF